MPSQIFFFFFWITFYLFVNICKGLSTNNFRHAYQHFFLLVGRGSDRVPLIFFSSWRRLENRLCVRMEDRSVLTLTKNRLFRAIYRFKVSHILRWSNDVMLSEVVSAQNWQKLNKKQKKNWLTMFLSYRNHSVDLLCKSTGWFLP